MQPTLTPTTAIRRASYGVSLSSFSSSTVAFRDRIAAAPSLALDALERDRMTRRSQNLITEAVAVNHARVGKQDTLDRYREHLDHFDAYLVSVSGVTITTAKRKHVALFMRHLEQHGGADPHELRRDCEWCRDRGYPDGRKGPGWSASYRKSYLSALRFFYRHCLEEDDLPDTDPTARMPCPKVVLERGYTPTRDEVQRLLDADGKPKDRLLAHWMFFAPSRRATFADARWRDIDLEEGVWRLVGKGGKVDVFRLHPLLRVELKRYHRWQLDQAKRNPMIRAALSDEETAFVVLTRKGKRTRPETIAKLIEWRAIRAGIALMDAPPGRHDAPGGKVTRMSPHALRRAWAQHALNHPKRPVPIDVVAQVLNHSDISTTRRHYAPTKPERANAALLEMQL